jgi:hypothetical protein
VDRTATDLAAALAASKRRAHTPLRAEGWRRLLRHTRLEERYPRLVDCILYGFSLGIPPIVSDLHPFNRDSATEYHAALDVEFSKELEAGRYIGPFRASTIHAVLGPFQSSPLSVIPKSNGGYRIIQNFSYPYTPTKGISSINSHLHSSDHPCTWGTFHAVALVASSLPEGSEIAVRDVKSAFRTIPIVPAEWPALVVRASNAGAGDRFLVDTANPFGSVNGPGVYGGLGDAYCDVSRGVGIGPLTKWVDDNVFFRILRAHLAAYNAWRESVRARIQQVGGPVRLGARRGWDGGDLPDGRPMELFEDYAFALQDLSRASPRSEHDARFTYAFQDIAALSDELGVIFGTDKDVPFGSSAPFTGLVWDVQSKTVGVADKKRLKYLAAIEVFVGSTTASLRDAQSVYGKLSYTTLVVAEGRAYLTGLERFMGAFARATNPFVRHRITDDIRRDLEWWTARLGTSIVPRALPVPAVVNDTRAYSDASSGVGIGIYIDGWWRAWRLRERWNADGRDIGWAEAVGFELLLKILIGQGLVDQHAIVWGDNKGVVEGWWRGRSRNIYTNQVFRRIHPLVGAAALHVHTRYVRSADNPADEPSRGIYGDAQRVLPRVELGPELEPYLLDYDVGYDGNGRPPLHWHHALDKQVNSVERARREKLAHDLDDQDRIDLAILGDEIDW